MTRREVRMDTGKSLAELRNFARGLGFELFGITRAGPSRSQDAFLRWLEAGNAAGMAYLAKNAGAFADPECVLPGVRSLIMLGMSYGSAARAAREDFPRAEIYRHIQTRPGSEPDAESKPESWGCVAAFTHSGIDYHVVIRARLRRLQRVLGEHFPGQISRGVVDTAPLHEREFARRAGLGFLGRNRMLTHPKLGSGFFIAAVLTTAELLGDAGENVAESSWERELTEREILQFEARCRTCGKCEAACPTGALTDAGLDARRCVSYLTIESREPIPEELRAGVGERIFGCDACQRACPWNAGVPEFRTERGLDPALLRDGSGDVLRNTPFLRKKDV